MSRPRRFPPAEARAPQPGAAPPSATTCREEGRMTHHGFQAVTDDIPAADGRLVICLGRPSRLPSPPGDRLLVFDQVDDTALGILSRLDPDAWPTG